MFLAKHNASDKVYAIKVLQKDLIVKQKEVSRATHTRGMCSILSR